MINKMRLILNWEWHTAKGRVAENKSLGVLLVHKSNGFVSVGVSVGQDLNRSRRWMAAIWIECDGDVEDEDDDDVVCR